MTNKPINAHVIVGAQAAYACITGPGFALDVMLLPGRSPAQSLTESAAEARRDADRLKHRAERMEGAAALLSAPFPTFASRTA